MIIFCLHGYNKKILKRCATRDFERLFSQALLGAPLQAHLEEVQLGLKSSDSARSIFRAVHPRRTVHLLFHAPDGVEERQDCQLTGGCWVFGMYKVLLEHLEHYNPQDHLVSGVKSSEVDRSCFLEDAASGFIC